MLKNKYAALLVVAFSIALTACSSGTKTTQAGKRPTGIYAKSGSMKVNQNDSAGIIQALEAQRQEWKGTRYRLGGTTRRGVDCSGFTQITYRELFGIELPRMTVDQGRVGSRVAKDDLQAGDLVLFKTGRGPNGRHVGIYVENGLFLHASTKGGVIYSDINSPYWKKAFLQGRRL